MNNNKIEKEPYAAPTLKVVPLDFRDVIATSDGTPPRPTPEPWETDILSHGGGTTI